MSAGPIVKQGSAMPATTRTSRTDRVRGGESITEFLVFTLGSARMGLPLSAVQEILKPMPITQPATSPISPASTFAPAL